MTISSLTVTKTSYSPSNQLLLKTKSVPEQEHRTYKNKEQETQTVDNFIFNN